MAQDGGRQSPGAGFSCPLARVSGRRQDSESRGATRSFWRSLSFPGLCPHDPTGSRPHGWVSEAASQPSPTPCLGTTTQAHSPTLPSTPQARSPTCDFKEPLTLRARSLRWTLTVEAVRKRWRAYVGCPASCLAHSRCSPNSRLSLRKHLTSRVGITSVGCWGVWIC